MSDVEASESSAWKAAEALAAEGGPLTVRDGLTVRIGTGSRSAMQHNEAVAQSAEVPEMPDDVLIRATALWASAFAVSRAQFEVERDGHASPVAEITDERDETLERNMESLRTPPHRRRPRRPALKQPRHG